MIKKLAYVEYNSNDNKTSVINDPLGQIHTLASSNPCLHFVLFC